MVGDLLVVILALTDITDYQLGLLGFLGTAADVAAFALLWSHSIKAWCDR